MPALPSLSHYFDQLNANHTAMMSKLDDLITAISGMSDKLSWIEQNTENIDQTIKDVQGGATTLHDLRAILNNAYENLSTDEVVSAVETLQTEMQADLDTISGQITAEGVKLTAIEGYTAGITPAVQAVETAVQALRGTGDTTLYDLLQELQAVETATQSIRGDKTLEDIYNLLVSLQGGTTFSDLATGEVIDCTLRGLIEKIHKLQGLPLDPRSGEAQYSLVTFRTLYDILGGADTGTAEPLDIWGSVTDAMDFIDDGLGIFNSLRGLAELGVSSANLGTTAATAAGTYITAAALAIISYQVSSLHSALLHNKLATEDIATGMNALTSETTTAGRVGLVDVRSDLAAQLGSLAGISGQITAEGVKLTALEGYAADLLTQIETLLSGEPHFTGTNLADLLVKLHCICQGVSELVLNAPAGDVSMLEPPAGGTGGSVDCQRARWVIDQTLVMGLEDYTSNMDVYRAFGRMFGVELSRESAAAYASAMQQVVLNHHSGSAVTSDIAQNEPALRCGLVSSASASAAASVIASYATTVSSEVEIQQMIMAMFPVELLNALYSSTTPLDPRVLDPYSSDCSDCQQFGPCCAGVDLGPVALTSQYSVDSTYHLSKFPSGWPCVSGSDPFGPSYVRVFVADGCELTIVLTDITTAELNITQPYTEPTPNTLVFTSVGAEVGFSNNTPTPFSFTARLREI